MREDMFKVIVERPRQGGTCKTRRHRLAGSDDLPTRIGSKRYVALTRTRSKWLNENLAPLCRYLAKQVGRPWNKDYSEICTQLDADHTVKQHVRDHLDDFVAYRLGVGRAGEWFDSFGRWPGCQTRWRQAFYVDPADGILKDSAKYWRKHRIDPTPARRRRDGNTTDPDVRWLSNNEALQRLDGLWFAVSYRMAAANPADTHVFDIVKRQHLPAGQRYAAEKRQLSGRELKDYGLCNEGGDDQASRRAGGKRTGP